jgi:hypothetical protein
VPIPRYALIIGAMKSGTTTLFHYLDQHPQIAGANPKEPGFFAFDDVFGRGRDWYDGLFGFDPARHAWALDGSTDYTKAPFSGDVRGRMASFADAEFRCIYLMRHPLRRMESHALHTQRTRRELGRVISDRPDHSLDTGLSAVNLAVSRYAEQLDAFRDLFDRGQLKLLTLEEFSSDPLRYVGDVCDLLGIDRPAELAPPKRDNQSNKKRGRAAWWNRLIEVPGLLPLAKLLIPRAARRALEARVTKPIVTPGRFRFTAEEEQILLDQLRPDLIRLRDVYGVDVERHWGIIL